MAVRCSIGLPCEARCQDQPCHAPDALGEESILALSRDANISGRRNHCMSKSTLVHEVKTSPIAGYEYGRDSVARSPVSLDELRQLEATVGWGPEDAKMLQRHGDLFRENAEDMVDSWRA